MSNIIHAIPNVPAGASLERPSPGAGVLAALALPVLLSSLGTSIANVALPALAREFHASFQTVQWVVISYLLAITTLIVSAGRLGDILGRRRLLLAGLAAFAAASIVAGLAPALWVVIAARALQGLGAAVLMALTMAMVGGAVPKAGVGSAMGLLGMMSALGTALGPSLGGMLLACFGWRAVFLAGVPLAAAAIALAVRHLPADGARTGTAPPFDRTGTMLLALTLAAYSLAMTIGRGHFGVPGMVLLAAALCGAVLFILVEARASAPLIRLAMLRDRALAASLAMGALVSSVMMATLVVGPFHLARALGLDAATAGIVMSAGPLVAAMAGVPAGRMADRFGARRVTVLGLSGMAAGALMLATLPIELGIAGYALPIVIITAGYALFQTANNTAAMSGIRPGERGVASGMISLSRNLGLISGAGIMGAIFARAVGAGDVARAMPAAVAGGTRATFAVAAALILAALTIALGSRTRAETDPGR